MTDDYIRKQDAVELCNNTLSKQSMWLVPSVDVAPVVHGKWMPQKGGGLCCSECNGYALDEPDGNFIHVAVSSKFCPHCGAKMDGGESDG